MNYIDDLLVSVNGIEGFLGVLLWVPEQALQELGRVLQVVGVICSVVDQLRQQFVLFRKIRDPFINELQVLVDNSAVSGDVLSKHKRKL